MTNLILIRHSLPEITPNIPASQWGLSEMGRSRCRKLADQLSIYSPLEIVSSTELKAQETAKIVASQLNVVEKTYEGLHEHKRSNYHWVSQEMFEKHVAGFFGAPQKLIMGDETAEQACQRFITAVERVIEEYPWENIAIVTHGTVITLYMKRHFNVEAFPFWKCLGFPSYVVLSFPEMKLCKVKFSLSDIR